MKVDPDWMFSAFHTPVSQYFFLENFLNGVSSFETQNFTILKFQLEILLWIKPPLGYEKFQYLRESRFNEQNRPFEVFSGWRLNLSQRYYKTPLDFRSGDFLRRVNVTIFYLISWGFLLTPVSNYII